MRAADLCLIPARPTIFDIWASEATRGKLKTLSKDYAFVLNQCPPLQESQRVSDGAAAVEAMGGLLRPFVVARVVLGFGTCSGYPASMVLIRREAGRTGQESPFDNLMKFLAASQSAARASGGGA